MSPMYAVESLVLLLLIVIHDVYKSYQVDDKRRDMCNCKVEPAVLPLRFVLPVDIEHTQYPCRFYYPIDAQAPWSQNYDGDILRNVLRSASKQSRQSNAVSSCWTAGATYTFCARDGFRVTTLITCPCRHAVSHTILPAELRPPET